MHMTLIKYLYFVIIILIAVYRLVIINEIDIYKFVGIEEDFLLNKFLTLENLVYLVRAGGLYG
jgi:hypothetical protein